MMVIARIVVLCLVLLAAPASAATNGMSIDCATSKEPFAATVCNSETLSYLDQRMVEVYRTATKTLAGDRLQFVKRSQADWWKARSQCMNSPNPTMCMKEDLISRFAVLETFADPSLNESASERLPSISLDDYNRYFAKVDSMFGANYDFRAVQSALAYMGFESLPDASRRSKLQIEIGIRQLLNNYRHENYNFLFGTLEEIIAKYGKYMDDNQRARLDLLGAAYANYLFDVNRGDADFIFRRYCDYAGPECSMSILEGDTYDIKIINGILRLGYPEAIRRDKSAAYAAERITDEVAYREKRLAEKEAARVEAERIAEAARAAEAERKRQAAENARQRRIAEAKAAEEAREAAARAAEVAEARRLHRTFGYQARLLGGAFVEGLKFIWAFVPLWVYGVAAALAWLVHRHLALRITFGIAAFAVIAYGAVYAGPAGVFLPGGPGPLLAAVWQAWTAYNPDIDRVRLAGNIVFTYVPVAVIAYCLTLALIGRDVRAAEAYRLRGFLPGWLRSWRYGFTQWRAERAERRRLLRDAKFQARLAAIQAASVPGNYAMAGAGGVPVVRLQRTFGDHIRVFGSVMGVLFGAGTLLFSWYVWYTDSASSWLAWIGQALWRSMKQEAGW